MAFPARAVPFVCVRETLKSGVPGDSNPLGVSASAGVDLTGPSPQIIVRPARLTPGVRPPLELFEVAAGMCTLRAGCQFRGGGAI